jgi:hypothetical protein
VESAPVERRKPALSAPHWCRAQGTMCPALPWFSRLVRGMMFRATGFGHPVLRPRVPRQKRSRQAAFQAVPIRMAAKVFLAGLFISNAVLLYQLVIADRTPISGMLVEGHQDGTRSSAFDEIGRRLKNIDGAEFSIPTLTGASGTPRAEEPRDVRARGVVGAASNISGSSSGTTPSGHGESSSSDVGSGQSSATGSGDATSTDGNGIDGSSGGSGSGGGGSGGADTGGGSSGSDSAGGGGAGGGGSATGGGGGSSGDTGGGGGGGTGFP